MRVFPSLRRRVSKKVQLLNLRVGFPNSGAPTNNFHLLQDSAATVKLIQLRIQLPLV